MVHMATDKELAIRLLDALEELWIERRAYRSLFKTLRHRLPPQMQMDQLIAEAKKHPDIRAQVHEQFAPLRDRIQQSADLSNLIEEFLRVVPAKKDVN